MLDASNLNDEDTIYTLLDACTNPDISELLDVDWFKDMLRSVESLPTARREVKRGARRLTARLRDWQLLEEALSNPDANFTDACRFLREIGTEEKSFGIWLNCNAEETKLIGDGFTHFFKTDWKSTASKFPLIQTEFDTRYR